MTKSDWPQVAKLIETLTLEQVGTIYGVSRERIRQVLRKMNVDTPIREFKHQCWLCPNEFITRFNDKSPIYKSKLGFLCVDCRAYVHTYTFGSRRRRHFEIGPCFRCGKRRGNRGGYCNSCNVWNFAKTHPEYRRNQLDRTNKINKERYRTDPEFKERLKKNKKEWVNRNYERVQAYHREYYATHPEFREKINAKARERYRLKKLRDDN